ncbi:MAG: 4Fe-4S dicluster domain-containing protein [Bacillota bacterium]
MIQQAQWEVAINPKWCKKCGLCAAFCPKAVIVQTAGEPKVQDESACIGCLMCEMHCPDFAIAVRRRETK